MSRRFVVVTGATGGIGAAICWRLHADGYGIIAQYRASHEKAERLGRDIRQDGGYFEAISCDLGASDGVTDVLRTVHSEIEKNPGSELIALVNNAARLLGPSFEAATVEDFDQYFALNVRAPFFLSQGLTSLLARGGSVVNISSAGAHFSSPGDIVYAMTKAALESLTQNMAEAIAASGLRVNTVMPGFTDNGHPAFKDAAVREYMSSFSVLGGVADAGNVADGVAFLISPAASRTTGSTLDVSGGSVLGLRRNSEIPSVSHLLKGDVLPE